MSRRLLSAGILVAASAAGCRLDTCAQLPQGFQLDILLDDDFKTDITRLDVRLDYEGFTFERSFDTTEALRDGTTSIGVELDPSTGGPTSLRVEVEAYPAGAERPEGRAVESFDISDDACNQVRVELSPIE